jgi:hypothetical protein
MENVTTSSSSIPSNHNEYWTGIVDDLPYVLPTARITAISMQVQQQVGVKVVVATTTTTIIMTSRR